MGLNDWGQIGDCTLIGLTVLSKSCPTTVAVTAGYSGSLFLKKDGSLWGMGINWGSDYGEGIEFQSKCPMQILPPTTRLWLPAITTMPSSGRASVFGPANLTTTRLEVASANNKATLQSSVASFPGYNLITIELLANGDVRLTYFGNAGVNYALERSSSLSNPNWVSLVTNTAPNNGVLVITNTPDTTVNNFWRIRSVQK